jgi:hypothetical protein
MARAWADVQRRERLRKAAAEAARASAQAAQATQAAADAAPARELANVGTAQQALVCEQRRLAERGVELLDGSGEQQVIVYCSKWWGIAGPRFSGSRYLRFQSL